MPVLGSCSTDTLAQVGPKPLVAGDVLPIRPHQHGAAVGLQEEPPTDLPTVNDVVTLDVVLGPRTDWFTAASLERLRSQLWQVTPQSNRVGLRLAGAVPLDRAVPDELPSEGTPWGAIQVPPSGQPVLFLADHPLTGGYPVIGCVATHHLNRAGQIPVHAWVSFNPLGDFAPSTYVAGDSATST
jgi:allophanate hydrolase subunit 2